MGFGARLRELRKRAGLRLKDVSEAVGTSKGYLSGVETEKVRPPSEKVLVRLARLFRRDPVELLRLAYLEKVPRTLRPALRKVREEAGARLAPTCPLLNTLRDGHPDRVDPDGAPAPKSLRRIAIPGFSEADGFAITVCDDHRRDDAGGGLRRGDLALLSRARPAGPGDDVFVVLRDGERTAGRLFRMGGREGDIVRLETAPGAPPVAVPPDHLLGLYRVAGRVRLFDGRLSR